MAAMVVGEQTIVNHACSKSFIESFIHAHLFDDKEISTTSRLQLQSQSQEQKKHESAHTFIWNIHLIYEIHFEFFVRHFGAYSGNQIITEYTILF